MNKKFIFSDLKSGIVVFLVALPLCLGIALACGVPLFSGIIAGVVGGIIVTSISNAKYSVSGPAAGLTAIVLAGVSQVGGFEYFVAAVIFAGVLQLILGLLKAGSIGNFIPNSVIKGMLAGIGIILIIKQIPHMVGYDSDPEGDLYFNQADGHNTLSDLYYMLNYVSPGAVAVGLVSVLVILLSETPFYKRNSILSAVPGPLLVVLVGILMNLALANSLFFQISSEHLVSLPKITSFNDLTNTLITPNFSKWNHASFWILVITIATVASIETLLSIEAIEKLDPEKVPVSSNRELLAQGVGNIVSGFLGGLPITSVIVRSSANLNAGARTKWSVIVHAILLLVFVLIFPGLLGLIPNASLAVILIMTGYKLAKVSLFKSQFKAGWEQFLPFVVTIVVMLVTDLLKGVGAGIVVSLFYIIRFNIRSSFEVREDIINGQRNYLILLPQHVTFFNKGFITNYLNNKVTPGSRVIIDGSINKSTDSDVKEVLADFIQSSDQKNIEIQLIKFKI